MYHHNKVELLLRFIAMDETWVHHFTPETTDQSKQWIRRRELCPKKPKTVPSASKIMASGFFFFLDAREIHFIDYLQKLKTISLFVAALK